MIREINMVTEMGRVRRLRRFSLADGMRRKSRKPAPLPARVRTDMRSICIPVLIQMLAATQRWPQNTALV
jgi:hypothetical protein